ncbi:ras-specific guanine nucleotide-releasing factor RalGPS2 [Nephila pilipes]|uniref:Ras-specific guanine nucleotide-releasing factor RalGPS2 n=1 Tax=Nephila pilipes TaxID=299642 RepID=A0A8X6NX70_NEPPI|nr:ras-specific guanine nucleotide-releasing factor RalGPS2 [Nephila pilipes]
MSSCDWAWSTTESSSPNVVKFLERFHHITHWTMDTIFSGTTPTMRAAAMRKFIKLIQHLHYRNDLQSSYAILSALQTEPIQRLHKTWKLLSSSKVKTFKYFRSFYSPKNNYAKLRQHTIEHLWTEDFPTIPYLALYLGDLMNFHRENSRPKVHKDYRNALMRTFTTDLISRLQEESKGNILAYYSSYKPEVKNYCLSIHFSKEEQIFLQIHCKKISLKLEPP